MNKLPEPVLTDELIEKVTKPYKDHEIKMAGVEFEGAQCSLDGEDQAGLLAAEKALQISPDKPVHFKFKNGSRLVITKGNLAGLMQVWVPARQEFYRVQS